MSHDAALYSHILNIIQTQEIHEQSDLQHILLNRGYDIPQATLSRHLRKLKVAKVSGLYKLTEFSQTNLPQVLNIQVSEFGLIILHTQPGNANSIAYYIDKKYVAIDSQHEINAGILGTIAGDDTVLLIIKSKPDLKNVLSLLSKEFPYLVMKA